MRVIDERYRPRRTGLMKSIADARARGVKRIPLKTAVDAYGAINIQGQVKLKWGVNVSVRRYGSGVYLFVEPKQALKPKRSNHERLRKAIQRLKPDKCLLLTTPIEVYNFHNLRRTLHTEGTEVRCKRNCTNLMVWKTS